jgi:SMODS and SLOG-associating 2TM effector domain family 5
MNESYIEDLKNKIWTTRGCRFNASRRLNNKYYISTYGISLFSLLGISISLFQILFNISECFFINKVITLISITLSIFVLIYSLLEGSKNYQIRSDRLNANALILSDILEELNYCIATSSSVIDEQRIHDLKEKYLKAIHECPENHGIEDYNYFKAQEFKHFKINYLASKIFALWIIFTDYWLYLISFAFIFLAPLIIYFNYPGWCT